MRSGRCCRPSASSCRRRSLLDVRTDRSASIRESVHDVKLTLWLTFVLVVVVIFIFLRSVTATIIASLTLPVTMVATFAVMYLLNYSLDNLSLMALTLSVGFVVDNTIVMLENIVRHMEMGKTPLQAVVRRLEGSGLHHRGDDRVAGGDLHPGPLHGRPRRPPAGGVRRHHRRRDHRLGLRLDQPDADAVQPVPEAAAQPAAWPALQPHRAPVRRLAARLRLVAAVEPDATAR